MTTQSALRLIIDSRPAIAGATAVNTALQSITGNATRTATATNTMMASLKPLIGFVGITAAVKTIADFERSMLTLQGVVGKTDEGMKELNATARELGATTEFTAGQAGEGMLELARAGFSASESMDAIRDSLKLATATGMELGEASGLMANAIRQFGLEADQAGHVASTFVEVANSANTTVPELGEAMKYVGTVASSLGMDITTTATAIGILGDRGVKGSMAGTQLRGTFLALSNQTDKLDAGLARLGLTYDQVNPATNDLVTISSRLKGGINSLDNSLDSAGIMAELFGRRNATAGLTLAFMSEQLAGNVAKNKELEDVHKKNAELIESSLIGQFKALISAMQEVFLVVGDGGLLGGFKALISTMTEGVRIVAGIKDSWDNASIAGKAFGAALKVMISLFQVLIGMKIIGFFVGMAGAVWKGVTALRAMTVAQLRLNAAMKKNLYILAATGVVMLYQSLSDGEEELISTEEAMGDLNTSLTEAEESAMAAAKALAASAEAGANAGDALEEVAEKVDATREAWLKYEDQLYVLEQLGKNSAETQKNMARATRAMAREEENRQLIERDGIEGFREYADRLQDVRRRIDEARQAIEDQAQAEKEAREEMRQFFDRLNNLQSRATEGWERLKEKAQLFFDFVKAHRETKMEIGMVDDEIIALIEGQDVYDKLIAARERDNEIQRIGIELGTESAAIMRTKLELRDRFIISAEKEAEALAEAEEKASRASEVLAEGFADAFTSMVTGAKSAKEAFKDMAQSIIQALAEIYIKQQLISFFTAGAPTGDAPNVTKARGGAYVDGDEKRFASGGIVNRPTTFGYNGGTGLMGEAGAEAIMPLKRDAKGNLGVASSGEGGGSKVINVSMTVNTPNADSFRRSKRQIQSDLKRITT